MADGAIPIPERMRHLKVFNCMAVPWGVLVDADGTPQFAINLEEARELMIRADLCSICGHPLLRGRWFVGGPGSALHPRGAYIDMPMHTECKDYAMTACPYLAAPRYGRAIGEIKAAQMKSKPVLLIDRTMLPDRPPLFVAVFATGQRMVGSNTGFDLYVRPKRPYLKVEYWRHGARLDPATAEPEARANAEQIEAEA
jgi:hypothetical protein